MSLCHPPTPPTPPTLDVNQARKGKTPHEEIWKPRLPEDLTGEPGCIYGKSDHLGLDSTVWEPGTSIPRMREAEPCVPFGEW